MPPLPPRPDIHYLREPAVGFWTAALLRHHDDMTRHPLALALLAPAAALLGPAAADAQGTAAPSSASQRPAARVALPVLAFPEPGLDDSAAYRGYRTRFFRDAAGNTLQLYLDQREGRVVHLWADAENESIGFTARDGRDSAATLDWDGPGATPARTGRARTLEYRLVASSPQVRLGHFLLGTMRVERDYQYWRKHREPLGTPAFTLDEMNRLLATLGRLDTATRRRHLAALGARDTATLRRRLYPVVSSRATATTWTARVVQPSLDGRDTMTVEIIADPRTVDARQAGDTVALAARGGDRVRFTVRVGTTGRALSPLTRQEIFTPAFLAALARARGSADTATRTQARRLERQVRGVELLSSREKLMAGLPTYATYFGRDMLVSALMMRPIWRPDMSAFAIGAALRKLSPTGEVSHEEALGGQAVREAAAEYVQLVEAAQAASGRGERDAADSLERRAQAVLRDSRRTRENYHMIDDELQLAILAARWLTDPAVPDARKRAFLVDSSDGGGPRVVRLVRELALVARMTEPYARDATAANLISFAPRDSGRWAATSWRDSGVGYANGRYAMDVNAVYAPHALEAIAVILPELRRLGFGTDALARRVPGLAPDAPLGRWARDATALRAAADAWWGAERHFLVRLGPAEVRAGIDRRLAAMPAEERTWWSGVLQRTGAANDSLEFLALALDAQGQPIGVANSDVATRLFLGPRPGAPRATDRAAALRDVRLFARAYPAGLLIDTIGPVVANDAWAPPAVWEMFVRDRYHSPRVAWGREVNLFLLGVAGEAARAGGDAAYARELRESAAKVRAAVEASGFGSELWSYEFENGRPVPVRYGSGADVQLWSTTDLAVWYALQQMNR